MSPVTCPCPCHRDQAARAACHREQGLLPELAELRRRYLPANASQRAEVPWAVQLFGPRRPPDATTLVAYEAAWHNAVLDIRRTARRCPRVPYVYRYARAARLALEATRGGSRAADEGRPPVPVDRPADEHRPDA